MARLSLESRQRVITLFSRGYTVSEIRRRLSEESTKVSSQALHNLLRKFREKMTIKDLPRRRRPRKLTEEMKAAIEEAYRGNDELTSTEIKRLLVARWPNLRVSVATIKRTRKEMGWVCTRPHYCQLLRPVSETCILYCVQICTCANSNYCVLDKHAIELNNSLIVANV